MKAAIYNPYLDTLGGGERYTLSFAKVLLSEGYSVDMEWKDEQILEKLEKRFGLNLKGVDIKPDIKKGDGYDLCFWVSDGSIPLMHARRNILHFQVPFHDVNGKSLINKMKMFRINKFVCNSKFTKDFIDKEFGVNSIVIYPPVDIEKFKPKRKENIILYVGRFSKILQSKGQEVLVNTFKEMCDNGLENWKLVLAGGAEVGVGEFVKRLKELSENLPIEIIESPSFDELRNLYGKAKIFWSASGYGRDEDKNPESMEHFGITIVEAMSAGAVPVIFNGGGHKEILSGGSSGYLWKDTNELKTFSQELISDSKQLRMFEDGAIKNAGDYSLKNFSKNIVSYILR